MNSRKYNSHSIIPICVYTSKTTLSLLRCVRVHMFIVCVCVFYLNNKFGLFNKQHSNTQHLFNARETTFGRRHAVSTERFWTPRPVRCGDHIARPPQWQPGRQMRQTACNETHLKLSSYPVFFVCFAIYN